MSEIKFAVALVSWLSAASQSAAALIPALKAEDCEFSMLSADDIREMDRVMGRIDLLEGFDWRAEGSYVERRERMERIVARLNASIAHFPSLPLQFAAFDRALRSTGAKFHDVFRERRHDDKRRYGFEYSIDLRHYNYTGWHRIGAFKFVGQVAENRFVLEGASLGDYDWISNAIFSEPYEGPCLSSRLYELIEESDR